MSSKKAVKKNRNFIFLTTLFFLVTLLTLITVIRNQQIVIEKAVVNRMCPSAEACPYPGDSGRLWSCHPGESDGTVSESLCNETGRVETCGVNSSGQPQQWCCPAVGGSWTTSMTSCAVSTPSPSPGACSSPNRWDVNQDGRVDIVDIGIVIDNYSRSPSRDPRTDINCDGSVNIVDIGLMIDHFSF
jgi:hypothetical protein